MSPLSLSPTRPHLVAAVGDLVAPEGAPLRPTYEVLETRWDSVNWWEDGPGSVQRVRLRFCGTGPLWDESAWVRLDWGEGERCWVIVKRAEERVAEALLDGGERA